jgi:hypothetical protein
MTVGSDIPGAEVDTLTHTELRMVALHRFKRAGEPYDKLKVFLDDVQASADWRTRACALDDRVNCLDWWGLRALCSEARVWMDEKDPPRSDLA